MSIDPDIQKTIVSEYESGKSMAEVGSIVGRSASAVHYTLRKYGVKTRSNKINSRKYEVNHRYFSEINSQEKAYWLGFLQTDGYLLSSVKRVGLAISTKDIDHLQKFKESQGATYPIHTYIASGYAAVEYSRIVITSDQMWDDLNALGITPQKTKSSLPLSLGEDLERHYVRGLLDGDGGFMKSKFTKAGYTINFCSASEPLARFVADSLGSDHLTIDKKKNVWYAQVTPTVERIDYLYEKANICLQRKQERALEGRSRLC